VILIVGPDGTGKSSLADRLEDILGRERPVRRVHHVFRGLPGSAASRRPSTEPHGRRPYPRWLSILKVAYLFAGHLLGWYGTIRPFVMRGGTVIVERGWWDMVVDPRRYRLGNSWLARRLAGFVPSPDLTLVLDAPANVIHARRDELEVDELARQLSEWRAIAGTDRDAEILDAARSSDDVLAAAVDLLARRDVSRRSSTLPEEATDPGASDAAASTTPRWISLPPFGRARWTVPSSPPRLARAGMMVHQPIRMRARAGWEVARALAGLGVFRAVPEAAPPDLQAILEAHLPPGGSVAVAHLAKPGRAVCLILDRSGRPRAVAKVAADPAGREKLAREAEALARFGPLVKPPLFAPDLLAVSDGVIVLEAAAWRPRLRPWVLTPELAAAIGQFHRCGTSSDGSGPTHGDFAPWNVLRTRGGWFLIDWEEARESGPAFWDPLHYLVQGLALLGRPRPADLILGTRGRGPVGEALAAYAGAAGVSLDLSVPALGDYLVTSLQDLNPDRPAGRRGIAMRRALLGQLGAAAAT
jgi:thymidylate kinase